MKNAYEAAKFYFPSGTDEELGDILMCCTAFPCCTFEHMLTQLQEFQIKASSPSHAITLAHQEMDLMWKEGQAQRELDSVLS